ncbi:acetylornithine deacetylase [Thalassovita taeanensis]|uniref:Acetylornithine deacetylase n=1 Tax=Thalassovita taeanensis TaxID=657014 RepID=A0A1H9CD53_9RHOB|nr:acetylornithine deacetylase [Thalassovita taeanensis]SEP98941.1 acetylornithine deacetylase [Thalassovita taeanensis]
MTALARTRDILADLIAFPTVSADSNLAMIVHMAQLLSEVGARVDLFHDSTGGKANLFATIGPDRDGGILLSGHSDVVPVTDQDWSSDPFQMIERDGNLYGRGTCDMKGFIAACLAMAPEFAARELTRPIHFAFTHDEEVGCLGARALVPELAKRGLRPAMAIIGEPTSMQIIEGHKGCCEYSAHFQGLEGHGSLPDQGVNAVEYAVRYVHRLLELRESLQHRAPVGGRFQPPWTTLNVGRLSGGTVHNVIASRAEVDWEMRPVQPDDVDFVNTQMAAFCNDVLLPQMQSVHPDATITTYVIGEVEGLTPMDDNEALHLVAELTGANTADLVSFSTEAGLFQTLGLSAVVCGPGSIEQAHKADEFVSLSQLEACLSMLHGLAEKVERHA